MKATLLGVIAVCSIAFGGHAHAADGAYGWATSNGATYAEELTPLAEAIAKGERAVSLSGYVIFATGRASGASSSEEAIAMLGMLGSAPAAGYLVAVGTYFDGAMYAVGYVVAGKSIPETTTAPIKSPRPASPETTIPDPSVAREVNETETSVPGAVDPGSDATETVATSTTLVETTEGAVVKTGTQDPTGGDTNGANVLAEVKPQQTNASSFAVSILVGMLSGLLGSRIARKRR